MGCVVNGPGESKAANIGISLPGTGEAPQLPRLHRRRARDDAARHVRRARGGVPDSCSMTTSNATTRVAIRLATPADREFLVALANRLADFDRPAWRTRAGDRRRRSPCADRRARRTRPADRNLFVAELERPAGRLPADVDARGLFHPHAARARVGPRRHARCRGPRRGPRADGVAPSTGRASAATPHHAERVRRQRAGARRCTSASGTRRRCGGT